MVTSESSPEDRVSTAEHCVFQVGASRVPLEAFENREVHGVVCPSGIVDYVHFSDISTANRSKTCVTEATTDYRVSSHNDSTCMISSFDIKPVTVTYQICTTSRDYFHSLCHVTESGM